MSQPVAPLSNAEQIIQRIDTLQQQLREGSPNYESSLHTIHQALRKDEEIVHLLSDEQIGVIVEGLAKKKNIVIATEKAKSTKKDSLKGVSINDL